MPALDIKDALQLGQALLTVVGVIYALKAAVAKLEIGQTEVLRQLGALHKRMDDHGRRLTAAEKDHAVLAERVEFLRGSPGLRASQRFGAPSYGEDK